MGIPKVISFHGYLSGTRFFQNKIKMITNPYNTIDFPETKRKLNWFIFLLIQPYITFSQAWEHTHLVNNQGMVKWQGFLPVKSKNLYLWYEWTISNTVN